MNIKITGKELKATDAIKNYIDTKAERIEKYFDDIFFSADYKVCKPDSKFYRLLLDKHNLNINESIMIGNDNICDIGGANDVGLDSLYLHSNLSPEIKGELSSKYSIMDIDIEKIAQLTIK